MSDGHVLLQCTQCKAKMRYRGRRTEVPCKKCGQLIIVQRATPTISSTEVTSRSNAHVASVEDGHQEPSYSIIADLVLGLLLGLVGMVAVSYFKETITRTGLLVVVCASVGLLAVQFYAFQLHRNTNFNKVYLRLLGLPAMLVVILVGFFAVLELCVPHPDGICHRIIHGPPAPDDSLERQRRSDELARVEEQKKSALLAKTTERRRLWDEADCLLVNPGHKVIGLRIRNPRTNPEFQVVAKVNDDEQGEFSPSTLIQRAWEKRLPILANDPQLARRVFNEISESEVLGGDHYALVKNYWQPARYVSIRKPVVYTDASTHRKRYGISHGIDQQGLFFSDLIPARSETVATTQGHISKETDPYVVERIDKSANIKAGTDPKELLEHELREGADRLDYFLFSMLRKLQYQQQISVSLYDMRAPSIYVDQASPDATYADQRLTQIREKVKDFQSDLKTQVERSVNMHDTAISSVVEKFAGVFTTANRELERQSMRAEMRDLYKRELSELKTEVRQLELLLEQQKSLDGEIRSRLIRTNMLLVERSDAFLKLAARERLIRTQNDTNQMVTQKGLTGAEALDAGMLDATHILLTSIRRPHAQGTYELSMRLVDARTGRIVWEDIGDRRFSDVILTVPPETNAQPDADKQLNKSESPAPLKSEPSGRAGAGASDNATKPSSSSGRSSGNSTPSTPQRINFSQTLPGTYTHSDPNGTRTITLMSNGELIDSSFAGTHTWGWRGRYIYMHWVIPGGRGKLPYFYNYVSVISEDGTSYVAGTPGNVVIHGTKE